ncbi:LacI family DNA-binding transcriptional regulator [Bifidobacterium aquikefiri]|uniref:LacI family DNA-binding transcriptional regulator n=1 Tax=Bifidobacterium aquikefiri TaxID=1653207 RepID=UPI0039E76A3E
MVGMRDVARKAGVSLSTVSLVVNSNGYVSDEMRVRVESAMKELSYVPNELARNLYHGRTNTVGVIMPTVQHPFFATLLGSLQKALYKRGLNTMLCTTADMESGEEHYVGMLQRHMMDAIIMGAHTSHGQNYWTSIRRPIVAFDRYLGDGIPSVGSDHEQGGELAAMMFALSGARHVVLLGGPRSRFHDLAQTHGGPNASDDASHELTSFPSVRYQIALEDTLDSAGIRHDYIEIDDLAKMQEFENAARSVLERFPDVDAIVAPDLFAALCVQEAMRRGFVVPSSLQILAYDGTFVTDTAGLRVTSILQGFDAIAERIAMRTVEQIERYQSEGSSNAHTSSSGSTIAGSDGDNETISDPEAGSIGDLIPMKVKIGATTLWNDAIHELLDGSRPQTD